MTPQQLQFKESPDYRERYSNSVQLRVTTWDMALTFGTMKGEAPEMYIENFERIILSPQQAKALANVLSENVRSYEATFGEIKITAQAGTAGVIQ